jgi:signal peptidase II
VTSKSQGPPKPTESNTPGGKDTKPPADPGGFAGWPLYLSVVIAFLVIDHASKIAAKIWLEPNERIISLIPEVFRLRYAENRGAAFSLFYGHTEILALVSVLAVAGLTWWWTRVPASERIGRVGIALVISGAIGNLIDRVARGYVVDFLDFYLINWPVFNIADSIICIGVGVMLLRTWQGKM